MKFDNDGADSPVCRAFCKSMTTTGDSAGVPVVPLYDTTAGYNSTTSLTYSGIRSHQNQAGGQIVSGKGVFILECTSGGDGCLTVIPSMSGLRAPNVFRTSKDWYVDNGDYPSQYNTTAANGNKFFTAVPCLGSDIDPWNGDAANSANVTSVMAYCLRSVVEITASGDSAGERSGFIHVSETPNLGQTWTTGTGNSIKTNIFESNLWTTYSADFFDTNDSIFITGRSTSANETYGTLVTGTSLQNLAPDINVWCIGLTGLTQIVITVHTSVFVCGTDVTPEVFPHYIGMADYLNMLGCLAKAQPNRSHIGAQRSKVVSQMYKNAEKSALATTPSMILQMAADLGKLSPWSFSDLLSYATTATSLL
jgi:hypothetical protein